MDEFQCTENVFFRINNGQLKSSYDVTLSISYLQLTPQIWPFSKSKFNLKSDRVNLVAPASTSVCFIYPMSGRYSTNWDRKGWPGSEIQMYYGRIVIVVNIDI